MLDFLKDLLGINRYHVAWDHEYRGVRVTGDTKSTAWSTWPKSKVFAQDDADRMNRIYGPGTHWIERA